MYIQLLLTFYHQRLVKASIKDAITVLFAHPAGSSGIINGGNKRTRQKTFSNGERRKCG